MADSLDRHHRQVDYAEQPAPWSTGRSRHRPRLSPQGPAVVPAYSPDRTPSGGNRWRSAPAMTPGESRQYSRRGVGEDRGPLAACSSSVRWCREERPVDAQELVTSPPCELCGQPIGPDRTTRCLGRRRASLARACASDPRGVRPARDRQSPGEEQRPRKDAGIDHAVWLKGCGSGASPDVHVAGRSAPHAALVVFVETGAASDPRVTDAAGSTSGGLNQGAKGRVRRHVARSRPRTQGRRSSPPDRPASTRSSRGRRRGRTRPTQGASRRPTVG